MNPQQTCAEILVETIMSFWLDYGIIAMTTKGFSDVLNINTPDRLSFNNWNELKIITSAKASQNRLENIFNSILTQLGSSIEQCAMLKNTILEEANKVYQDDFLPYYRTLDELESEYIHTGQLNGDLLQQLAYHAEQLVAFRQYLGDLREAYWREANEE